MNADQIKFQTIDAAIDALIDLNDVGLYTQDVERVISFLRKQQDAMQQPA